MKKCRICKSEYIPYSTLSKACSLPCALKLVNKSNLAHKEDTRRKERKELKKRKDKLKTRSDWLKEAQKVFNQYVRLRDRGLPCCSCDKPDNGLHQRHASHYKSVGSNSALRFNLWNINASCSVCNNFLSGNIGEYRPRLIKKIGIEKVDWIESKNQPEKYEIEYLKRLKKIFRKKIRRCKVSNI